ncbi:MAG: hypothetical protein U5L98_08825 [Halomonas sp.]|uniref:hypothetical protein n=1 Tax=Halomonas sp. TaxID=1486246 RepID=UPI002ACD817A|nr:hypothetical protein [Halomonas sp.]MDZ7852728.1 hypothetical protein [Halomonas sp.]
MAAVAADPPARTGIDRRQLGVNRLRPPRRLALVPTRGALVRASSQDDVDLDGELGEDGMRSARCSPGSSRGSMAAWTAPCWCPSSTGATLHDCAEEGLLRAAAALSAGGACPAPGTEPAPGARIAQNNWPTTWPPELVRRRGRRGVTAIRLRLREAAIDGRLHLQPWPEAACRQTVGASPMVIVRAWMVCRLATTPVRTSAAWRCARPAGFDRYQAGRGGRRRRRHAARDLLACR